MTNFTVMSVVIQDLMASESKCHDPLKVAAIAEIQRLRATLIQVREARNSAETWELANDALNFRGPKL